MPAEGERPGSVAAVIIGRNEGERLVRCLSSLAGAAHRIVYVDSGSTDGSVAAARAAGAAVVDLDRSQPFTAARARNAGVAALAKDGLPTFIQFIDGDCELRPGWIGRAVDFLDQNPRVAVACGRRRERHPERSVYNRLCDREWDTPVGETKASGGDALMRATSFVEVQGFNPALIAGEEPELCVRLRAAGWSVWRLDAEMTLHDAAMTQFSQWWKRMRRSGYASAEGAALHGGPPERHGVKTVMRAILWSLVPPLAALVLTVWAGPWGLVPLLAYPAQMFRLWRRYGRDRSAFEAAVFTTLGKVAEFAGIIEYWGRRVAGRPALLIEYKGAGRDAASR